MSSSNNSSDDNNDVDNEQIIETGDIVKVKQVFDESVLEAVNNFITSMVMFCIHNCQCCFVSFWPGY